MARPEERATVVVRGKEFRDWTSVMVQHRVRDSHHTFAFTCSEVHPTPSQWPLLQFRPGDDVEILLADKLAITGKITVREVGYDAERHGVRLIGRSKTADLSKASVDHPTGRFDGYGWSAIARSCIAPFGIGLRSFGDISDQPFRWVQLQPAETVWGFLERLARFRGILLSSSPEGDLVAIGPHKRTGISDALIEGANILKANCIFNEEHVFSEYNFRGQSEADDETWGDDASKLSATVKGSASRYLPHQDVAEHPVTASELQARVQWERMWREGSLVDLEIVTQGWLKPDGSDIWRIRSYPHVRSPMLMLDASLGIDEATFTQDNDSGTLTTLKLRAPWAMNEKPDFSAANPSPNSGVSEAPSGDATIDP